MPEPTKKDKKTSDLVAVKFERAMVFNGRAYRKDEVAGFSEAIAKDIEDQKFGKKVK